MNKLKTSLVSLAILGSNLLATDFSNNDKKIDFEKAKLNLEEKASVKLTDEQVIAFNNEVKSIKNSENQISESDYLCYDFYKEES
ncbi:hypothetical protein HOK00_00495 [bacterium]|jgi:hypothetical protein|nr:hypothetical protein [bacterium]